MSLETTSKRVVLSLALLSALIYNIWPLAYWLDPKALHNDYLSVLEITGRPHAWVFKSGDILTALMALVISFFILKRGQKVRAICYSLITFSVGTLFEALVSLSNRCSESIAACGLSPLQIVSVHDIASIITALALLYGLIAARRALLTNKSDNLSLYKWTSATFYVWGISGLFLIISVGLDKATLLSQAVYLLACGLALIMLPMFALNFRPPAKEEKAA